VVQETPSNYFLNNSVKNELILTIFGTKSSGKWIQVIMHLSTTSEKCQLTTLRRAELVHLIEGVSFPKKVDGFEYHYAV